MGLVVVIVLVVLVVLLVLVVLVVLLVRTSISAGLLNQMGLSFTQNGYFSLKNRQHLFLVVQNASRCIGTKGEDHSENSGRNQKMTPTPTRMLQDPPWCSRKCIELAKTTSFAAYCRTLNPLKRSNWPVFVSNLWIEVTSTFLFKYFYCRKVW